MFDDIKPVKIFMLVYWDGIFHEDWIPSYDAGIFATRKQARKKADKLCVNDDHPHLIEVSLREYHDRDAYNIKERLFDRRDRRIRFHQLRKINAEVSSD